MATISARGFASATTPLAPNPTLNLTTPAGEAGDLLVLGVLLASNQAQPEDLTVSLAQDGWVLAGDSVASGVRHIVWHKNTQASAEPITVNFSGPSEVRAVASVARYAPHSVTAVKHHTVYSGMTPDHMLPGDATWSDVNYLAVYTADAGSSPTTFDTLTLQNEHLFPTGLASETLRVAFASGTNINAGQESSPGSGDYSFGNVSPVSNVPYASVVWALVLGATPETPRIRSSVSEDAGSLFQATQAVAVELGISEAFEYGTDIGSGLRAFREVLTPESVSVRYYAVPTRNQEMLATVEGETNLGRLAHTIAPRIFTRGLDIPGNVDGIVTAQQAIQYVVDQFAAEHPWLVFEPVPDLRALEPDAVGNERQYYLDNPAAGVLTIPNVVIEQQGNERRTMREVLDEWTSIFQGTTLRQTSSGTIELVPRVGPDAPDGPSLNLAWRDFARFSDGEDDPRGVYNHARVTSQGWDWVEEQALIAPSFTVVRGENGLARSVLDSEEVLPTDREEFEPWAAVEFTVMANMDAVEVDVGLTAFGSWSQNTAQSFSIEGTTSHNFTLLPGQYRDVTLQHTSRGNNVVFRTRVQRAPEGDRITLSWPSGVPADARSPFGITFLAYEVTLDATGTAWTRSNQSIEAEWGTTEHHIPAEGGGDALAQSRALYGVRSATIQSNVFQLTPEQAMAVARGYVLHNINPRTVRDVQQSEWNRYPVKFDHIGRFVELPNGEVAIVENRSYSDSFAPRASAMMSTFTAAVSHSVIDTTTPYLHLDNGDFFELDDGTLVEAS